MSGLVSLIEQITVDMKVKATSFVRLIGEESLLCDLRTGSSILLKDAEDFLRPILVGDEIGAVANVIAKKHNAPCACVLDDMMDFYRRLSALGLCALTEGGKSGGCVVGSAEQVKLDSDDSEEPQNIVADFYSQNNLLCNLHVDLTDACTERCVHCYVPQEQHDFLPYSLCEKVLREFREQQGLTVQLSGGECMMHPDFGKICRLCRKLDLNFIVLSNLTLCDEDKISVLKETDPQFVNVSLYSMKAEEHDAITRIRGSWKHTMAAIDACQNAGVHIRLATPLLKINKNAYSSLRQFAHERRVHVIPDCDIIPMSNGDCSNLNYACTPAEVEAVLREDKAFWDREYGRRSPQSNDKVCDIGKLLCLNSKGDYYPCSGMHGYVLGNARDMTLTDVWHGERFEYLRSLKNKDFPKCANCEHRAFCKVCPAFNFNATGDLFKTIPEKCALAEVKHRVFGEE